VRPGIARDHRRFRDSLRQIQSFARERPDVLVITGHDRQQWPTLEPVYT